MSKPLTDVKYVGSATADKIRDIGFETVEQLATCNSYELIQIDGINLSKAHTIKRDAIAVLSEDFENLAFDPVNKEYYDAGPDYYECVCGGTFNSKIDYKVHKNRCEEYKNLEEDREPHDCSIENCDREAYAASIGIDERGRQKFEPLCKSCFAGKFAHVFQSSDSEPDSEE